MTKDNRRFLLLAASISVGASVILYLIHYFIFEDWHHIFIYMLGDLAFMPLEVFLVIIIIERLLTRREQRAVRQKLNMVVGSFYSEVGNYLLGTLLDSFNERSQIIQQFNVANDWNHLQYIEAARHARRMDFIPDARRIDLEDMRTFLASKRTFLEVVLGNPHILEHEDFTDLLWATLHFAEELDARQSIENLPKSDLEHLAGDVKRMYGHLVAQWLSYVEHLKEQYPYLFSLTLRTQPFQENPSAVVT